MDQSHPNYDQAEKKTSLEYKSLDLFIRMPDETIIIEALGPNSEWATVPTTIPERTDWEEVRKLSGDKQRDFELKGDELGSALLPGPILALYKALLQRILAQPGMALQIKLHFIGKAESYAWLPWEVARVDHQYISMDRRQSIVRTLDLPEPALPLSLEKPPYRIIWVIIQPNDVVGDDGKKIEINAKKEQEQVNNALKPLIDAKLLEVTIFNDISPAEFEKAIKNNNYHILYYTGLSSFDNKKRTGILYFRDKDGTSVILRSQDFAEILRGSSIRTAFINTGQGTIAHNQDSTSQGILGALIEAGIPMVIGHNYWVSDAAAIAFAGGFFSGLVQSNSVVDAMFFGRRSIVQATLNESTIDWFNPVLFTRTSETRFWSGEAGYMIETFLREGKLISKVIKPGEFDPKIFANRLQTTKESLKDVTDSNNQLVAKNLISEAEDAIASSDQVLATQKLSESSISISLALAREKANARRITFGFTAAMFIILAMLIFFLRDHWNPDMVIPVIGIPISVLVWSFIGGVASILRAFITPKKESEDVKITYEWLLWRPVVGIVMGSAVYLAIASGFIIFSQGNTNSASSVTGISTLGSNYLLWLLTFLGGFSDRFAEFIFDKVVGRFTEEDAEQKKAS